MIRELSERGLGIVSVDEIVVEVVARTDPAAQNDLAQIQVQFIRVQVEIESAQRGRKSPALRGQIFSPSRRLIVIEEAERSSLRLKGKNEMKWNEMEKSCSILYLIGLGRV